MESVDSSDSSHFLWRAGVIANVAGVNGVNLQVHCIPKQATMGDGTRGFNTKMNTTVANSLKRASAGTLPPASNRLSAAFRIAQRPLADLRAQPSALRLGFRLAEACTIGWRTGRPPSPARLDYPLPQGRCEGKNPTFFSPHPNSGPCLKGRRTQTSLCLVWLTRRDLIPGSDRDGAEAVGRTGGKR